jgi:hypothetical protein
MVSLDELEKYFSLAIAHARRMGLQSVTPGQFDYYRTFADERFELDKPTPLVIGSLYDDFEELKKLSIYPDRVSALDLDRIAEVLHLLSDILTGQIDSSPKGV